MPEDSGRWGDWSALCARYQDRPFIKAVHPNDVADHSHSLSPFAYGWLTHVVECGLLGAALLALGVAVAVGAMKGGAVGGIVLVAVGLGVLVLGCAQVPAKRVAVDAEKGEVAFSDGMFPLTRTVRVPLEGLSVALGTYDKSVSEEVMNPGTVWLASKEQGSALLVTRELDAAAGEPKRLAKWFHRHMPYAGALPIELAGPELAALSAAGASGQLAVPFSPLKMMGMSLAPLLLTAVVAGALWAGGAGGEAVVVVAAAGLLLFLVVAIANVLRTALDACPECGRYQKYWKAEKGKLLVCRACDARWVAGTQKP